MNRRARLGLALTTSLAAVLLPTSHAFAAGDGGGGGGGGGRRRWWTTGSVYSDLNVLLRAENGTPILKKYEVPATTETEATTEYCAQPVSYDAVPGVTASVNPLDGRQVWVLPLQGEWLPPYTGEVPVAEIEPCDAMPKYAMFVSEVELERLKLARTSDQVIADNSPRCRPSSRLPSRSPSTVPDGSPPTEPRWTRPRSSRRCTTR